MLLNIIFSYNRAMQLDYLLQSILKNFKIEGYEIAILYHTTGEHAKGYLQLQEEYKKYDFIKFYERKEGFDIGILPALNCRTHLRFFKNYHFKNKKRDNFKGLLEQIMKNSPHKFVMFNTDDGVFLDEFHLDEEIRNLIEFSPNVTYRTYVGDNLEGFPDYVQQWKSYYLWDYYHDKQKVTHWSYPFAVDGTIYHLKYLLSIIKKIAYHNPVTLEANSVEYIKRNKLLGIGISPIKSILIGTILNRVSVDSFNPTLNISVDQLNNEFLNGNRISLTIPEVISISNIVPEKVHLVKGENKILLYEKNTEGENLQSNYGAHGTKNADNG